MWISKKKWEELEKRVPDLEKEELKKELLTLKKYKVSQIKRKLLLLKR